MNGLIRNNQKRLMEYQKRQKRKFRSLKIINNNIPENKSDARIKIKKAGPNPAGIIRERNDDCHSTQPPHLLISCLRNSHGVCERLRRGQWQPWRFTGTPTRQWTRRGSGRMRGRRCQPVQLQRY